MVQPTTAAPPEEAPVASDAPPPETEVQAAPGSPAPGTEESQSTDEQLDGLKDGLTRLQAWREEEVRRERQSERQRTLNELETWEDESRAQSKRRTGLQEAESRLEVTAESAKGEGGDPKAILRDAAEARRLAVQVSEDQVRDDMIEAVKRRPEFKDLNDEEIATLRRANDRPVGAWLTAYLDALQAAHARGQSEALKPAVRREVEAEIKAQYEAQRNQQAAEERGEAPPRAAPGVSTKELSFEQLEHLFATGEATDEQTNAYIQERHRRGIVT